jgi:hypothetical protein
MAFWDKRCLGAGPFAVRLERFDDRATVFVPIVTPAFTATLEREGILGT